MDRGQGKERKGKERKGKERKGTWRLSLIVIFYCLKTSLSRILLVKRKKVNTYSLTELFINKPQSACPQPNRMRTNKCYKVTKGLADLFHKVECRANLFHNVEFHADISKEKERKGKGRERKGRKGKEREGKERKGK